jgi:hypothetical protein
MEVLKGFSADVRDLGKRREVEDLGGLGDCRPRGRLLRRGDLGGNRKEATGSRKQEITPVHEEVL